MGESLPVIIYYSQV